MMTVVTTVSLKDAARNQWDRAMHERVRAAADMDGWVAVQLLREVDHPQRRAIIGTWESREQERPPRLLDSTGKSARALVPD
jgi:heme-degrading monooxygenase HmoA